MLVHDIIKIKYIREGYLPNYPHHMISTSEMCDAFMRYQSGNGPNIVNSEYFYDAYTCPLEYGSSIYTVWKELQRTLVYYLRTLKYSDDTEYKLPDWVYSYMLGAVIGPQSNTLDIHDLILPLGVDNIDDEFGAAQEQACYEVSKAWISRTKQIETHIITETEMKKYHLPSDLFNVGDSVKLRPPTIFGEPHVIKSMRLSQISPV